MVKTVIFDLDGTLLNTLEDLANACNYALRKCNFKVHPVKDYVRFIGSGRYILIQRILPQEYRNNREVVKKVLELFDEYYTKHMLDMTTPYKGILELINEMKNKNIKLAVVSNKPHEFIESIVKKYFGDSFDIAYGQRLNHPVKPDPKTVYEVIQYLNATKEECLYVGDSDVDMHTAQNAGVKSVGVAWGFRGSDELKKAGADFIINSPEELLKIIDNID